MPSRKAQKIASRKSKSIKIKGKLYIFCNGVTEKSYFEEIRKELHLPIATCKIESSSYNRKSLVVKVAKMIKRDEYVIYPEDKIFIVFDADIEPKGKISYPSKLASDVDNACHSCKSKKYISILSNESFELWLLLHFEDIQHALHRDDVEHRLKTHIPDYVKGKTLTYSYTKSAIEVAKQRAKKLALNHEKLKTTPSKCNPVTYVYKLVEEIEALKKITKI